jgi:CheY-like chemotaxis protein
VYAFAQEPAPNGALDVGAPAVETNPAVRAALELPRETPADYFQAIIWLIDLDRPELAKPILAELTKLQLTDVQRAELVAEFGSRDLLRLARAKELAPAASAFADACMTAAAAAANDPQRIAALVAQLADPTPEIRQMARSDLAAMGQAGVTATLAALSQDTNPDRRALLVAAAAEMHPLVVGPLLAMLETNNASLRADVAQLLGHLNVVQAVPLLQARSISAEPALMTAIEHYQQGTPPFAVDEANQVELWHWNDTTKKLTSARYPADEARTIWISRLTRELAQLRPENRDYQRQALLVGLEAAHWVPATRRSPAMEQLTRADLQLLNDVLADALESNYAHAAVAVIDALATRGDAQVLLTPDAQPSPLSSALIHPNRRVRYAALRAIMKLDPASPYPGSSRVPDALAWFAGSTGERRALVAMPTLAASTNLAGMLAAHELDGQATNRGRDAVDLARDMADLEMIFLDMNLQAPGIRQVVYELRISPTTGEVPIALMAAEDRLEAAEQLAAEHQRVIAVSRPHSQEVLARVVERLVTMASREPVSPDERAAQAVEAATWLNQLAARRPFYTIRRTAHSEP